MRIKIQEKTFHKKFWPNWSEGIYTIAAVNRTPLPTYRLKDYRGQHLRKKFYEHEIQSVKEAAYRIERVIRTQGDRSLVRWLGFGPEHDSWEDTVNITDIQNAQ